MSGRSIMKRYKSLVVDYDNTLADKYTGEIDVSVKKAIRELVAKGFICSIVTGRPYFGRIKRVCNDLNLTYPQIVSGGAEIRDPNNDSILWAKYIDNAVVKDLIAYFSKRDIYFTVEKEKHVFTPDGGKAFYSSSFIFKKIADLEIRDIPIIVVSPYRNNMSIQDLENLSDRLMTVYKTLYIVKIRIADDYGLAITSSQATKQLAIAEYLNLVSLHKDDLIGMGDGYNDYPLLQATGLKVAMHDAPKELQEIADVIVGGGEENGILTVINNFIR